MSVYAEEILLYTYRNQNFSSHLLLAICMYLSLADLDNANPDGPEQLAFNETSHRTQCSHNMQATLQGIASKFPRFFLLFIYLFILFYYYFFFFWKLTNVLSDV